jgi:hypothetical protein
MTIWKPWAADLPGPLYRRVAKALEQDIAGERALRTLADLLATPPLPDLPVV